MCLYKVDDHLNIKNKDEDGPNEADVHTRKWELLTADGYPAEFLMTSVLA